MEERKRGREEVCGNLRRDGRKVVAIEWLTRNFLFLLYCRHMDVGQVAQAGPRHCSLVPGLPRSFCSSVCIDNNTRIRQRKPKNRKKRGRPGNEATSLHVQNYWTDFVWRKFRSSRIRIHFQLGIQTLSLSDSYIMPCF